MTEELSKRQQMNDLIRDMMVDQNEAMIELGEFIRSEEMGEMLVKLEAWRERTVPGSSADQSLGALLMAIESIKTATMPQVQPFIVPTVEAMKPETQINGGQ